MKISIRLQQEFGLRRKEAGKYIPAKGVKEDHIVIKKEWTKGKGARTIPITTASQRELLKDIAKLKQKNASLVPAHMSYKTYLSHRDHHLAIADIWQEHGLRHYYVPQRYISLSKGLTPPMLHKGERPILTPPEQALDIRARLTVSQELRHARIEATRVYLGQRKQAHFSFDLIHRISLPNSERVIEVNARLLRTIDSVREISQQNSNAIRTVGTYTRTGSSVNVNAGSNYYCVALFMPRPNAYRQSEDKEMKNFARQYL